MADDIIPTGLTEAEVRAARTLHGWNELPTVKQTGPFRVLLRQFSSFLVLILIVAAAVALALGERVDALTIGLVVVLNAGLGFVQEWKAETALNTLRDMLSPKPLSCAMVESKSSQPKTSCLVTF
ncbi:cation-transporting P-type ATPase [Sulfitobacter aestuariivivens]|uniref:cation-transporting P-type ATPase n=1 Tax=Sulfitobacter aestuariivivens TaxID=2766981 RepID=UPI0036219889